MSGRDRQRARVYAWEDRVGAPHAPDLDPFSAAQAMVDAIWAEMGLCWPPKVERLPAQGHRPAGRCLQAAPPFARRHAVLGLLHELAHAMTSTAEGQTDGHGPRFMGLYLQMLERYLRLPIPFLLPSLQEARIRVEPGARPLFLNTSAP